jgi:hypothetical protein
MDMEKVISRKSEQLKNKNYIEFTDQELQSMRADEAEFFVERYHGFALMKMPKAEIEFFEWLKKNDVAVWNDIWEEEPDMYLVSTDLLPTFLKSSNGFPICDLIETDNYWFSERHIKPKGRQELEEISLKVENKEKLQITELFLIELLHAPIDIWHFCYRYKFPIQSMKVKIEDMVSNGWLVHLKDREDLVKYIEI